MVEQNIEMKEKNIIPSKNKNNNKPVISDTKQKGNVRL